MRRTSFASLTPAPPTIYFVPLSRNSYLAGSDRVWTMIGGGLIGGLAGGASAFVGAYVGAGMADAGIGGFYAGAVTGGTARATAGLINGFGLSTLETGNRYKV